MSHVALRRLRDAVIMSGKHEDVSFLAYADEDTEGVSEGDSSVRFEELMQALESDDESDVGILKKRHSDVYRDEMDEFENYSEEEYDQSHALAEHSQLADEHGRNLTPAYELEEESAEIILPAEANTSRQQRAQWASPASVMSGSGELKVVDSQFVPFSPDDAQSDILSPETKRMHSSRSSPQMQGDSFRELSTVTQRYTLHDSFGDSKSSIQVPSPPKEEREEEAPVPQRVPQQPPVAASNAVDPTAIPPAPPMPPYFDPYFYYRMAAAYMPPYAPPTMMPSHPPSSQYPPYPERPQVYPERPDSYLSSSLGPADHHTQPTEHVHASTYQPQSHEPHHVQHKSPSTERAAETIPASDPPPSSSFSHSQVFASSAAAMEPVLTSTASTNTSIVVSDSDHEEVKVLKAQLSATIARVGQTEQQLTRKEAELRAEKQKWDEERHQYVKQLDDFKIKVDDLQSNVSSNEKRAAVAADRENLWDRERDTKDARIRDLELQLQSLDKQVQLERDRHAEAERAYKEEKTRADKLSQELDSLRRASDDSTVRTSSLVDQNSSLERRLQETEAQRSELEKEVSEQYERQKRDQQQMRDYIVQTDSLKRDCATLQSQVDQVLSERDQLTSQVRELRRLEDQWKQDTAEQRSRQTQLEHRIQDEQNLRSELHETCELQMGQIREMRSHLMRLQERNREYEEQLKAHSNTVGSPPARASPQRPSYTSAAAKASDDVDARFYYKVPSPRVQRSPPNEFIAPQQTSTSIRSTIPAAPSTFDPPAPTGRAGARQPEAPKHPDERAVPYRPQASGGGGGMSSILRDPETANSHSHAHSSSSRTSRPMSAPHESNDTSQSSGSTVQRGTVNKNAVSSDNPFVTGWPQDDDPHAQQHRRRPQTAAPSLSVRREDPFQSPPPTLRQAPEVPHQQSQQQQQRQQQQQPLHQPQLHQQAQPPPQPHRPPHHSPPPAEPQPQSRRSIAPPPEPPIDPRGRQLTREYDIQKSAPFANATNEQTIEDKSGDLEHLLMKLGQEKTQLDAELQRLTAPGAGRTIRERKRLAEIERRLELVNGGISDVRMKLREQKLL